MRIQFLFVISCINVLHLKYAIDPIMLQRDDECKTDMIKLRKSLTIEDQVLFNASYYNQCVWLEVPYLQDHTGIAHAVSFLNQHILLAKQYSLTLRTEFGPSGHKLSRQEVERYFGFSCAFYDSHEMKQVKNVKRIYSSIQTIEEDYTNNKQGLNCRNQHHSFDFFRYNMIGRLIKRGIVGAPNCDFSRTSHLLRAIFETRYRRHRSIYVPKPVLQAKANQDMVIVLHIRRGDLFQDSYTKQRIVSFEDLIQPVRLFLKAKLIHEAIHRIIQQRVSLFIVTERAPGPHQILEYDRISDITYPLNVTYQLREDCSVSSGCSVRVLMDHEASALQSFSVFCESDVLFPTWSGFSHLSTVLCPSPSVQDTPYDLLPIHPDPSPRGQSDPSATRIIQRRDPINTNHSTPTTPVHLSDKTTHTVARWRSRLVIAEKFWCPFVDSVSTLWGDALDSFKKPKNNSKFKQKIIELSHEMHFYNYNMNHSGHHHHLQPPPMMVPVESMTTPRTFVDLESLIVQYLNALLVK